MTLDFNLEKQAFEINNSLTKISVPTKSYPKLERRILTTTKEQRRLLRREIERWISKSGPIEIEDLRIEEFSSHLTIFDPQGTNIILKTECGCLRIYFLFTLSELIRKFDDLDTKIFQLVSKVVA